MSRIGRLPISIPKGVNIEILDGKEIKVSGPLGKLERVFPAVVEIVKEDSELKINNISDTRFGKMMWGTVRAVVNNMVHGVSKGFEKQLQIEGVGYKAEVIGKILKLYLGYSHHIEYPIPANIDIKVDKNIIFVKGFDKELVGSVSADIRGFKEPEPYKGKGIRYVNEKILRKAGKTRK